MRAPFDPRGLALALLTRFWLVVACALWVLAPDVHAGVAIALVGGWATWRVVRAAHWVVTARGLAAHIDHMGVGYLQVRERDLLEAWAGAEWRELGMVAGLRLFDLLAGLAMLALLHPWLGAAILVGALLRSWTDIELFELGDLHARASAERLGA